MNIIPKITPRPDVGVNLVPQESIPTSTPPLTPPLSLTGDQARDTVLGHLSPTPCEIDHLAHATQLPASQLLTILIELELTGQIQRLHGNQVARA